MNRALLQQALYALNDSIPHNIELIDAIVVALAQPEPSPVAWKVGTLVTAFADDALEEKSLFPLEKIIPLYAAPPSPDALMQSTHAADVSKKDAEIDRLHEYFADMTAQRDRLMWGHAQVCEKADTDRLDAQRYRWLCDNNFDKVGITQIHTIIKTWEPHSQTGEPQLWSQRARGGALDVAIDNAIATGGQP